MTTTTPGSTNPTALDTKGMFLIACHQEKAKLMFSYGTALIAIFTCTLGVFLREWLDRARLTSVVHSIGFSGDTAPIEIPDSLRKAAIGSSVCSSLHRFETYKNLQKQHYDIMHSKARLDLALLSVRGWLAEHREWADAPSGQQFGIDGLEELPIVADVMIYMTLALAAARQDLAAPPADTEAIKALPPITDSDQVDDAIIINLRTHQVKLSLEKIPKGQARRQIEHVGNSLICGSKCNAYFYMKQFESNALRSLQEIEVIVKHLESVLLAKSHIVVGVSLCNYGPRPIVVRPFGRLEFIHEDLAENALMLIIEPMANESTAEEPLVQERGDEVHIEPFLPDAERSQYTVIGPRSSLRVSLRSTAPLGTDGGRKVKVHYTSSLLKCRLCLLTLPGKLILSSLATFGFQANPNDQRLLSQRK